MVDHPLRPSQTYASPEEVRAYKKLVEMNKRAPIPDSEILDNLVLFQVRPTFARILFLHRLYLRIINTHGSIMEFGVRWGKDLALFTTFRNIYEPYNMSRKIIGFDTFKGFPSVGAQDALSHVGDLAVTPDYEIFLEELLMAHEQLGPRSHIRKHELVKGDVVETLPAYLANHPETIIAMAYFDLDLYEPTKRCLELIRPHLVKNSVVAFDELALDQFPGETQALREAWGLSNCEIIREPTSPQQSYLVVG